MSDLESKTTEVQPTLFDKSPIAKRYEIEQLIETIINKIDRNDSNKLIEGTTKQGKKSPVSLNILRDCLNYEIDNLKLSKNEEDNTARLLTSQVKKSLKTQVDSIVSILEQSVDRENKIYYHIGIILKALQTLEQ